LATIGLTQGKQATVDDKDYAILSRNRWYAMRVGHTWYAARHSPMVNGKRNTILMHREIIGDGPTTDIDHINGDGLDNRSVNLRFCDRSHNMANQRKTRGASRYKGVARDECRGKWRSGIKKDGVWEFLGRHDDEVDAALSYDIGAISLYGEFSRPNFLRP
jgi:hypothetical protein